MKDCAEGPRRTLYFALDLLKMELHWTKDETRRKKIIEDVTWIEKTLSGESRRYEDD